MNILYVLGFLTPYIQREIEALTELGFKITILLPWEKHRNETADLWKRITPDCLGGGIPQLKVLRIDLFTCRVSALMIPVIRSLKRFPRLTVSLKESELRYFLAASEAVRVISRSGRFDVIHAHFAHDQAHVARIMASLMKLHYTVTVHATDIFVPRNVTRLKRVLAGASTVFSISRFNMLYLEERGLGNENMVLAKLGLDPGDLPERAEGAHYPLGVCTASGLVPKKGVNVLIDAAILLKDRYPDLRFKIIGSDTDGHILDEFRRQTAELPVEFTGALSSEETLREVAGASFFVLPCVKTPDGDMDGIPVSLMEAMAMGIPSISTHISGIPELITHEVNGLLAEPGSADSLALMIGRTLDDPEKAEEMAKKGLEKVLSDHSTGKLAGTLAGEFRKTLDRSSPQRKG